MNSNLGGAFVMAGVRVAVTSGRLSVGEEL
jgi:hypothetical protein